MPSSIAFERGAGDQKPCAGDGTAQHRPHGKKTVVRGLVAIPDS